MMAAEKKSFVLYHDIRTPLELLTDEQRGKLFIALLDYSEHGELPDFDGALLMVVRFSRLLRIKATAFPSWWKHLRQ